MRNRMTDRIAKVYKRHQSQKTISSILRRLLIDSLAPQEGEVYDLMEAGQLTSGKVVQISGMKLNQASTILKRLHKYGLATRRWDTEQFCFVYNQGRG